MRVLLEHGVTVGLGVSVADKVLNTRFDAAWVRLLLASPRVLAYRVPVFLDRRRWRPTERSRRRRRSHSCRPISRNCSESARARDMATLWLRVVMIFSGIARWWASYLPAGGSLTCCRLSTRHGFEFRPSTLYTARASHNGRGVKATACYSGLQTRATPGERLAKVKFQANLRPFSAVIGVCMVFLHGLPSLER